MGANGALLADLLSAVRLAVAIQHTFVFGAGFMVAAAVMCLFLREIAGPAP